MDSDTDSSSLSSAPEEEVKRLAPIFMKAKKATKLVAPPPAYSPPRPKRPPSPPHEEAFADNPDIAFVVMFRSRFHDAFPTKLPNYGPQDIESGVTDIVPSPQIENLLCALLALVLNRKKPIERGHHGRALEEAVTSHKSQWPRAWNGQNPLQGGKDFSGMTATERLSLLRTLTLWALSSSEVISNKIKDSYKQARHNDDENQALSVQYWGLDGDKRRYYLIQGIDDTSFRVYREGSRHTKNAHWWSIAGNIDEVKTLAEKLEKQDGSQSARRLSVKIMNAIPMFEATEEKRRRREYRQQRRAAFSRPEPGFGIYEGRTRGKRLKYNYDEDDDFLSDDTSTRRSTRHQSARSTPFEAGPTFTASGRQVKHPRGGDYGERLLSGQTVNGQNDHEMAEVDGTDYGDEDSDPVPMNGRATRSGGNHQATNRMSSNLRKRKQAFDRDSINDISDASEPRSDGGDGAWSNDDDDDGEDDPGIDEEDDDTSVHSMESLDESGIIHPRCLIVRLKVPANDRTTSKITPPTSPPSGPDETKMPPSHTTNLEVKAAELQLS